MGYDGQEFLLRESIFPLSLHFRSASFWLCSLICWGCFLLQLLRKDSLESFIFTALHKPQERFRTGHYHTHFREYDCVSVRWLSEDPAGYVDGLNLYKMYAGVNGRDVLGLETIADYEKMLVELKKKYVDDYYRLREKYSGVSSREDILWAGPKKDTFDMAIALLQGKYTSDKNTILKKIQNINDICDENNFWSTILVMTMQGTKAQKEAKIFMLYMDPLTIDDTSHVFNRWEKLEL